MHVPRIVFVQEARPIISDFRARGPTLKADHAEENPWL